MHIAWYVLLLIAVMAVLLVAFLVRRRVLVTSRGAIEMSVHRGRGPFGGWALGVATFSGGELRWYRLASLRPGPAERFSRSDGSISGRRSPRADELTWIPPDAVIFECTSAHGPQTIALSKSASTGLLSWWESVPPGYRNGLSDF
ncbi:uncharacterized protein DUF2550 [Antricoccus suffuscus]|uniref:Uncharacterized protein DUF2550 n=1 Tax=Antricoccus suffuscus TaxID=1629062 RepID=A0A2T1A477_9ACTN|nr:DUF2550 domain-containing protein [Antricoccus suffuscus]PRZ43400.1 uncharacterized protein DUF2550 [Antricoccus suffuscus]